MSLKDESGCVGEQIAGRKNRNRETVGSRQRGDIPTSGGELPGQHIPTSFRWGPWDVAP